MKKFSRPICAVFAAVSFAVPAGSPARAADASPWVEDSYSAIRLIAGAGKDGDAKSKKVNNETREHRRRKKEGCEDAPLKRRTLARKCINVL